MIGTDDILQFAGGHPQPDDGNFLLFQFLESDATEHSVLDAMLCESVDENVFHDFLHCKPPSLVGANSAGGKSATYKRAQANEFSRSPTLYGDLRAQVYSRCSYPGTLSAFHPYKNGLSACFGRYAHERA